MTKKTTPKDQSPPPGVEWYTVGKGFAKKHRWHISAPFTPEKVDTLRRLTEGTAPVNSFEGRITGVEAQAIRILERAGLPTDPRGIYTIPEGKPVNIHEPLIVPGRRGDLCSLVKARGYKEREDTEWYAAEILSQIRFVRASIARNETVLSASEAAVLGELVGEAKAFGYYARMGSKKKRARRIIELERYIRSRRREPSLTAEDLWDEFTTYGDGELYLDGNSHGPFLTYGWKTLTRNREKNRKRALIVDGIKGREAQSITKRTFLDYWDRNQPTRAK